MQGMRHAGLGIRHAGSGIWHAGLGIWYGGSLLAAETEVVGEEGWRRAPSEVKSGRSSAQKKPSLWTQPAPGDLDGSAALPGESSGVFLPSLCSVCDYTA